ncbi:MAG: pilE [Herminiimonas sp.]|jgi:type IV pilus assembly protein PilE|nr:pilE [Herminiimonas sp.]
MRRCTNNGFSLIELMIAVAIIGILTAVAMPMYSQYVMRGKIPEATTALSAKRVQMEQFFQDNRTYAGAPACNNDTVSSRYFTFSCPAAATGTGYTLRAVGIGSMAGFVYTVDQTNTRATTSAPSGWATNANCWVTAKGGAC